MLIVVHNGIDIDAIFLEIFRFFSAQRIVVDIVALDDFEKNAVMRAGSIPFAVSIGEIPFIFKKIGKVINA